MSTTALSPVFDAFAEGAAAQLVTGRSLHDLTCHEDRLRPLFEVFRREARRQGLHVVTFSRAAGLDYDAARIRDERDRATVEQALRANGLTDLPRDQHEVTRVIRGISALCRTPTGAARWADGQPARFAFLFEFAEHLAPGALTNGSQSDAQIVAIELAHLTAQSLSLRSSGNLVVFHGRDGMVDPLVAGVLHAVVLSQPEKAEKREFLDAARQVYSGAAFDDGLTTEAVAHLTTHTPNRGLEALMLASERSKRPITAAELSARKSADVRHLSDGTLGMLDAARVAGLRLCGRNIASPQRLMDVFGDALLRGDAAMPGAVLLAGAPGSGKTDLALLVAARARVSAYEMHSPKAGIVGETERRTRLQQSLLAEFQPNVAFIDEITEAFPMQRSDFDGDSGASRAVMASLLTALSDETRRGRSLLVATTNCPWRISAAMLERFLVIPVLSPLRPDYADILLSTAARVDPDARIDITDERVQQAAGLFFDKSASPRAMRRALGHTRLLRRKLDEDAVLFAARDYCSSTSKVSSIYADLWAVQACSQTSLLPWHDEPGSFPFPSHLAGVIDPRSGERNDAELQKRIEELRPHANV